MARPLRITYQVPSITLLHVVMNKNQFLKVKGIERSFLNTLNRPQKDIMLLYIYTA